MNGDDLRARLAQGTPVLMPGVWDALSARLVVHAGFDTAFVSGFCVSGTRLGLPDFGYLTQTEMAETARRVCRSLPRPHGADRRRHRLRQPAQRHPHGRALRIRRRGRPLPGRPGVAEEVRAHGGQAGRTARRWLDKLRAAVDPRRAPHHVARTDAARPSTSPRPCRRARPRPISASTHSSSRRRESLTSSNRSRSRRPAAPRRQHDRERPDTAADAGRTARPRILTHRLTPCRCLFAATKAMRDVLAVLHQHGTTATTCRCWFPSTSSEPSSISTATTPEKPGTADGQLRALRSGRSRRDDHLQPSRATQRHQR